MFIGYKGTKARLGFKAPRHIPIDRRKVFNSKAVPASPAGRRAEVRQVRLTDISVVKGKELLKPGQSFTFHGIYRPEPGKEEGSVVLRSFATSPNTAPSIIEFEGTLVGWGKPAIVEAEWKDRKLTNVQLKRLKAESKVLQGGNVLDLESGNILEDFGEGREDKWPAVAFKFRIATPFKDAKGGAVPKATAQVKAPSGFFYDEKGEFFPTNRRHLIQGAPTFVITTSSQNPPFVIRVLSITAGDLKRQNKGSIEIELLRPAAPVTRSEVRGEIVDLDKILEEAGYATGIPGITQIKLASVFSAPGTVLTKAAQFELGESNLILHEHPHSELYIVREGKGIAQLGMKAVALKRGDVVAIPTGTIHTAAVTSKEPLRLLNFFPEKYKLIIPQPGRAPPLLRSIL